MTDLAREVRSLAGLWGAWRIVRTNGSQSASRETVESIRRFEEHAERHLGRIARQLREDRFRFSEATGVPVPRSGKQPRPIVVTAIQDRIVQRRILDVLQAQPALLDFLLVPTSFGGIKGRGVREALSAAISAMQSGARFFLRSDIKDFFSNIPKAIPLAILDERLPAGAGFRRLLHEAVDVELENLAELGSMASLFPLSETGVAQGSCLSLLLGNILLHDFDRQMNGRGIVCLRYVDDFLLLGPTQSHVMKAFDSASGLLTKMGLSAYDPRTAPEKSEMGPIQSGFTFLGAHVIPGLVRPSSRAQAKLLQVVEQILGESERQLSAAVRADFDRRYSVSSTLHHIGNVLKGWAEQYSFCNSRDVFVNLNTKVTARVRRYRQTAKRCDFSLDELGRSRALGVPPLTDAKRRPIEWRTDLDEETA